MKVLEIERDLIKGCKSKDRAAQHALYQEYRIYLFGICSRYAKSREEAQDMLQEAFLLIFRDISRFKGDGPLRAWLRKVTVNAALMHLRKNHKLQMIDLEDQALEQYLTPDFSLFQGERAQAIIALLQQLPPIQQTVFNMHAMDGYSFKEIANRLDIKENTLRSHLARARKKLKSMLKLELEKNG